MNTLPAPASASVVGACPCFAKKKYQKYFKSDFYSIITASTFYFYLFIQTCWLTGHHLSGQAVRGAWIT